MPLRVAYVDDETDICEMFEDIYASPAISIRTFTDPKAALASISDGAFDVVLMDYRMPNITGDQLAKALKVSCPVVLITGDLLLNPEFKFHRIFYKPYSFDEMRTFLEDLAKQPPKAG